MTWPIYEVGDFVFVKTNRFSFDTYWPAVTREANLYAVQLFGRRGIVDYRILDLHPPTDSLMEWEGSAEVEFWFAILVLRSYLR